MIGRWAHQTYVFIPTNTAQNEGKNARPLTLAFCQSRPRWARRS